MSKGFNLTAELNLRGPSNIRTVVADIRRQVGSVSVNITPTVNRQSIRTIASTIRSQLSNITSDVKIRANTASLRSIGADIRRQLGGVTANVNVRANQSSIRAVASDIRRQLGSINTNVNVRFNTAAVTTYGNNLRALNNNLNQITASATNATAAINALTAAMRGASTAAASINNASVNVGNLGRAAGGARNSIALASNEMIEFGRQSGLAFRRFSAITTVTGIVYGLTNAIRQGVASFIDFDLQMTRIAQVTGDAKNELGAVANTITNLSTTLGASSAELTKTTVTLAQAGLTAKDTATALRALALSALAPSFDDMNQTVEGSIALMRQFGIGANQLEMALGSVNAVSAKFAVEASDIITAIQRTGGVFASASKGVSTGTDALNEFIAVFTSIRATTRESAETIATGLRTIFTRVQRAETIESLKEFGVTLTDLEGKFVGPYVAVQRLSEGLSRLDPRDLKFSQIVEELGGFRQIGKVLPLIQQFATAQDALSVAQQGQGSLAADAAKGQLALAVQIQKVREEFLALIRSIGETSSFQNMVKVGLDLASALIKVADATKGIIPLLTMFAAFKGISTATQYISGFGQGIRGRAARGSAEGGRIYAFASGGLVPGSGDRDTVSARLTPGEFVMRKSAVQSIGAGNLYSLNRNSGGIIPTLSSDVQKFEKGSLVNKKVKKESIKPIKNEFGFTEIIKTPSSSTQASHITELLPLEPRQIKQAILATKDRKLSFSIEQALGTSPKEINKNKSFKSVHSLIEKSTDSEIKWLSQQIGLDAQRDIKINLPSNYNQALRRGDPRLIAKSDIIQWISKNNTVLNPLPQKIKSIIDKNWIANLISSIIPKNPPSKTFNTLAYDEDSELTSLGRHFQKIYETNGVSNAVILKFKGASKDFYKKLGGYGSGTGGRGDRTSIQAESIGMNIGGLIQKFGIGGGVKPISRTVGVIDSDDWKEDPIVAAQMKMMGITKLDEYKVHMSNLVAEKRKSGGIRRLRTVFGVAASGKTTAAYGGARSQEADNARLRKTTRRAIRVPSDLEGLDEVIDTTSVLGPRNAVSLRASDRIRNLSSRSKAGQEAVISRRKNRDRLSESGVPDPSGRNYGLFNRRPGATDGAPVDTGIDEAWLAASEVSGVDPKKVITTDVATGRRIGAPNVRTPEKTTVFSGNVGPMTSGHVEAIMKGSKKAKTRPEDTVIYVAGNTPIDPFTRDDQRERTAIFPQTSSSGPSRVGMAQAVLGSKGFNVSAAPKGIAPGAFPKAFKVEGQEDSYIVPKSTGNFAIIGNDKPDSTIERNRSQGYEPIKIARNGISGTDARAAIMSNDIEAMERLLTPEGIAYLKPYMSTLQKRPKLLDSILARIQENAQKGKGRAGRYSSSLAELSTLPARVTAKTPADVATRVKELREQRDIDEAVLGRRAARMLPKLERLGRSSGGVVQRFMVGGAATESDETTPTKASVGEIIKLLGLQRAAAAGGISSTDVYTTLNKRTPTPQQAASKAAILAEFTKQKTALASKAAASQTRKQNKATAKGLVFGAAGLFGSAFATQPVIQTIQDSKLKDPNKQHTVSIYSGVYKNQKRASSIDASFDKSVDTIPMQQAQKEKRAEMVAQKKKAATILGGLESGRELNLDFDRTLAFGADKILADPKQPRFSEFSDTTKVTEALSKAKLSVLGRRLASLVAKKPDLLKNIRVITARPKVTLPLIQTWLSSKGLPIPDSQFKGLGGPTISGSDIAKLKAAELTPGSIFVDDDKRNTAAARKRADEGIDVYRYRGVKKLKEDTQSLENIESLKGNLLEAFIRRLGAVGSPKGNGFDFMNGLGKVSQKFDPKLPPKIPTDVKRTLAGPSTIKDNIVTYLKNVKGYNTGGAVQTFIDGGAAQAKKPQEQVLSSSPTPMLQAILGRVKKNPEAKDYQFSEYRKKITDRLNQAYKGILMPGSKPSKEDVTKDTVISMYDDYVTRGYIDTTVGTLEKDLSYVNRGGGSGTDKQALKKRKGVAVGDMLDTIRGYQALGLDYVVNTALTEGRTDETIAEFMGADLPKSYKTTGRGDIKISSLVKNLEAAAQYKMPETLYSGLGKSKLDNILRQTKTKPTDSIDQLTDKIFSLPSFVSSSDEKGVANTFARVGQMMISTNPKKKGIIPDTAKGGTVDRESVSSRKKKTKLIDSKYGDRGIGGMYINESYADSYDSEAEYIFPPNSNFKILSAQGRLPSGEDIGNVDMKVRQLKLGGMIQNFMTGGAATKTRKPKEPFGTGETQFPSRISKSYAEEQLTADDFAKSKLAWDKNPKDERIMVDDEKVKMASQQPFDRARFATSFKEKINRDTLFDRMSDFAKFVGLPQEDLSVALPLQLDFGASKRGGGFGMYAAAQFEKGAVGVRPYEGYDLSKFGYGEKEKQESYGLDKLIIAKEKEIKKITKTPVQTYDDGSFSFDREAYSKANNELSDLKNRLFKLKDLKLAAEKAALTEQNNFSSATGRGTISFAPSMSYASNTPNSTLYHEMTHQLFQGLRTRSEESFNKYRTRVMSLFSGDNDDLADAFDSLAAGGGYSSADVVYGRSYKSNNLSQILASYYRQNLDSYRGATPIPEDLTKNLASLSTQSSTAKRAREYRPINPKVNQALLQGGDKFGMTQQKIDRMEDNGKEEFLTTLIEKAPQLDQNLQGILDSTLTELLSGAGIQRQKFSVGRKVDYAAGAEKKVEKQYGKISITEDGNMISAGYLKSEKENSRQGHATASKLRDNLYYVGLSSATKGYGPRLYDVLMESATEKGAMLTSDRSSVSGDARKVWEYYFKNRGDVKKTPLEPKDWTQNEALLDPKLYGRKETWPPATDPAWILQSGYSKSPSLIKSPDVVRASTKPDSRAMALSYFSSRTPAFADGGTVPALVSNGEAYVPPKLAKKIGYGRLNQMNQADRNGMGRFSGGGISVFKGPGTGTSDSIPANLPVGSFIIREKATKALGFSLGGSVQRFAFGGGPRAVPDISGMSDARALSVVGVTDSVTSQLENLATVLQELGVRSSDSARIIQSGTQATYQQAIRATEADIRRARLAGASAAQISQAENQLADIRRQSQQDITTRRTLGRLSGAQLQQIDSGAQEERNRLRETRTTQLRSTGMSQQDIDTQLASEAGDIDRAAYRRATRRQGINLGAAGLTGDDAQRFVRQSMGDPRVLRQMDAQYVTERRRAIAAEVAATGDRTRANRIRAGLDNETNRSISDEIRARREVVNTSARQRGQQAPGGDQRGNFGGMLGLSFGLQGLGSLLAQQINASSSASNAATAGAIQGGVSGLATGAMLTGGIQDMLGSSLSPAMSKLLGGFGFVATAAAAVGQAFIDSHNAVITFEKTLQQNKVETALSDSQKLFEKLNNGIKNIDVQRTLTSKLAEAGDAVIAGIELNNSRAKAMWVNLLDVGTLKGNNIATTLGKNLYGFAPDNDSDAMAQRSEILEKKGTLNYLRSTDSFGEGDIGRRKEYGSLIPEKARENSKSFAETAKLTTDLIGAKIQSGSSVEDIFKDPAWAKQAEVIARSNAAVEQEILTIRNRADISNLEKEARIKNIISINAEEAVRQRASVVERQKQMKSLDDTTNVYTRSLERMFQNMEQSIGRASFSLEQMSKDIDLVSDSLQGQAKIGGIALTAINTLQNPRAYSDQAVSGARNVAAESFGIRSPEMVSLLGVGEKIESTVMSTINKTVNKNPGITNEALGIVVGRDVKSALADLSLPADLVDKLSGEVGNILKDFQTSGEDKLDYTKLSEKLGQLNRVVDSSKRAQEVAIKALEFYQNALNTYAQNINKTIDLQISANQRLRKATDIVTDSELSLAKTLGKNISLENARATVNSRVAARTGGVTNPNDIFDSINKLENTRTVQQAEQRSAADRGVSGQADFIKFTKNLADTNVGLRENIDALKYLADNTDIAASAMEKIQEAQQKASGRASFIEKLVTSTPEELNSLSGAFQRLQNNANGQINTINRSVGAQRAYYEALQNGASMMEAMKAAQGAFVNERKETLGALNDIIPFLGDGQQAGNVKANVLESMLQESGIGVSPLFQQILNTLRNPEMDPATQAAIAEYREGNNLQARANALLAQLDSNLARDIASQSAKALANALSDVKVNFEGSELKDLVTQVQQINAKLPIGAVPPVGKASGGVIYAAAGRAIDFKSQGTDTVPAMLTPGEFVVNRAATQRNLPLLHSINSNKYSGGGPVKYYSSGGYVSQNFKSEYKKSSDDLNLSREKYIDPASTVFSDIKSVFAGPDKFVRGVQPTNIKAPLATGSRGKASLASIQSTNSIEDLYLGEAPGIIVQKNKDDQDIFNYTVINRPRAHLLNPLGYVIDKPFDTKNITKNKFAEYRDNFLQKLRDNDIDLSTMISSRPAVDNFENIRQSFISDEFYNPNVSSDNPVGMIVTRNKNLGAIGWNKQSTDHPKTLKLFKFGSAEEDATMVSDKDSGLYKLQLDLMMSETSAKDRIKLLAGDNSWVADKDNIDRIIKTQELNIEDIKKSQTFAFTDPDPTNAAFNNLFKAEDPNLSNLRQKLEMLHSGAEAILLTGSELNFFDPKALHPDHSEAVTLLHVLSDKYRPILQKSLNTKEQADKIHTAFPKLMVGGAGLKNLDRPIDSWATNYEFGIYDVADMGKMKTFPWVANADPSVISQDIQAAIDNQAEQLKTKYGISTKPVSDFGSYKLKLPDPIGDIDLPYHMQYTEYTGPQIATDPSKADSNGFNLAANLNKVLLMTPNNKNPFSPYSQFKKYDYSTAYVNKKLTGDEIFDKAHVQLDQIPDFATLVKGNIDRNQRDQLKENLKSVQYSIDLDSLTDHANHPILKNIPLFTDSPTEKKTHVFSIGEYLSTVADKVFADKDAAAQKAVGEIDDKGQLAGDTIKDNKLTDTVKNLAKLSLGVFGRRRVPGLPGNWLYNSIRGVLQKPFKDSGVAKQAAGYTSNVFGNFGGYLSKLAPMTRNANVYQQLKELFTLGSGAAMAFAGLASGDTRMIGQFTKLNLNAEDLFRTLGGASLFGRISSTQLSGDYQAILGQQLEGAKIKTVGANGTLSPVSADKAMPQKYSDLVNVAFNPYNEFPSKDTRKGIIEKLTMDMINARDQMGLPYFDPNTQRFLYGNMTSLYNWYGGNGVWEGQDYFFDKNADPDNAKRTQQVIDSLRGQAGQDAYSKGNIAHNTLGFASRYGSLPTDKWFVQRREAGLNAEAEAITNPNATQDALRFATGGVVYAQDGKHINFQPRGTDTVPAMLTPGEFVINRAATQRNLPLLHAINNGGAKAYSDGGTVYLARGGLTVKEHFKPLNTNIFDGLDIDKNSILEDNEIPKTSILKYIADYRTGADNKLSKKELEEYNTDYGSHINNYMSVDAQKKYNSMNPQKQKLTGSVELNNGDKISQIQFIQTYEAANKIGQQKSKWGARNTLEENFYSGDPNYPFSQATYDLEAHNNKLRLGVGPFNSKAFGYGVAQQIIPALLSLVGGGVGFALTAPLTPVAQVGGTVGGAIIGDQLGQFINQMILNGFPSSWKKDINETIEKYPESYEIGQWTGFAADIAMGGFADDFITKSASGLVKKKLTRQAIDETIKSGSSLNKLIQVGNDTVPIEKTVDDLAESTGKEAASNSKKVDKSRNKKSEKAENKAKIDSLLKNIKIIGDEYNSKVADAYNKGILRKYDETAKTDVSVTLDNLSSIRKQAADYNYEDLIKDPKLTQDELLIDLIERVDNAPLYVIARSEAKTKLSALGIDSVEDFTKLDANKMFDEYFNKEYDILSKNPLNEAAARQKQSILDDITQKYDIDPSDFGRLKDKLDDIAVRPRRPRFKTIYGLTKTAIMIARMLKDRKIEQKKAQPYDMPEIQATSVAANEAETASSPEDVIKDAEPNLPQKKPQIVKPKDISNLPKYWDELSYKEYLDALIKSGKAPEIPDKKLFTTSAIYTRGERTTALDSRDTTGIVGGNRVVLPKDPKEKAKLDSQINNIGQQLYTSSEVAYNAYSRLVAGKKQNVPLNNVLKGNLIDNYRQSIESMHELMSITNLDKFGTLNFELNKPLPGQSSNKKLGDIIDTLKAVRKGYKNDIVPNLVNEDAEPQEGETPDDANKRVQRSVVIDDSILDLFGRKFSPIVETRPDAVPNNGKKFTGREVSDTARENDKFPLRTRITGNKGIESQYKSAFSYYRRILGEYNYHKSIGKSDRYAQGHKTTSRVARTLASGGVVYASTGALIPYQPRGTDTVPAMLTPGEFVVNAKSTRANLPLLKSINSNTYLAKGGSVGQTVINIPANTIKNNLDTINTNAIKNYNISTDIKKQNSLIVRGAEQTHRETLNIGNDVGEMRDQSTSTYIETQKMLSLVRLSPGYQNIPEKMSTGGIVYAADGTLINYQPRGTDTVPAMLTPGEFVVNAQATRANLPLLQSINQSKGGSIKGFAKGGVIYATDGGTIPTKPDGSADTNFDARKAKRTAHLQRQIEKEEKAEFIDRLGILYNDTTNKENIADALKRQKDYRRKIDYYIRQFTTDKALDIKLKRFPRISEAAEMLVEQSQQPTVDPFAQPDYGPGRPGPAIIYNGKRVQAKAYGGVVYAQEGMLVPSSRELHQYGDMKQNTFDPSKARPTAPVKPEVYTNVDPLQAQRAQRKKTLIDQINDQEKKEFTSRLGILYNDTTNEEDIIEALKKQRDYPKNLKRYMNKSNTDNQLKLTEKRFPRIEAAIKSMLAKEGQAKSSPFDPPAKIDPLNPSKPFDANEPRVYYKGVQMKAGGGVVYASEGTLVNYQPRGTDTVPAMLTPGEFVVNAKATSRNLSLLQSINNGVKGYSNGGVVDPIYRDPGGETPPLNPNWNTKGKGKAKPSKNEIDARIAAYKRRVKDKKDNSPYQQMLNQRKEAYRDSTSEESTRQRTIERNEQNNPLLKIQRLVTEQYQQDPIKFQKEGYKSKSPQELAAEYEQLWSSEPPEKLYDIAKAKYFEDQKRYQGLKTIYSNSLNALALIRQRPAFGNTIIPQSGKRLVELLNTVVKGSYTEGLALDQGWKILGQKHPEFLAQNSPTNQRRAAGLYAGGLIYANTGMLIPYQPRGTDTVPAMLTPGEFVVNKQATQNNLDLLKQINSNRYNQSGAVAYKQSGGPIAAATKPIYRQYGGMTDETSTGGGGGVSNNGNVGLNLDGLSNFTATFDKFIQQLNSLKLPEVINIQGNHKVDVVINGAAAFQGMQEGVRNMVLMEVNKAMASISKQTDGAIS